MKRSEINKALKELEAMDVKYSPKISLIREFVGGSDYDY